MDQDKAARIDALFAGWGAGAPGGALTLLRGGAPVLERRFGLANLEHGVPIGPETRFHIASITKTFVGAACALLHHQGRLDLDADITSWIPELRPFTGKDGPVRDYVLSRDRASGFLENALELLKVVAGGYVEEGKRYMTVAVGCTGGKHRSVAITETLAEQLSAKTTHVVLTAHRDLGRE